MDNKDSNIPNKLQCVDDWRIREDLAQWKSLAISLYHENQMLHAHLRDTYMDMIEQEKSEHDANPSCSNHSDDPIIKNVPSQEPLSLVWEGEKPKLDPEVRRKWCSYVYFKRIRRMREISDVLTPVEDDEKDKKRNRYEEPAEEEEEEEKPLNLISNERPIELKKLYGTQGSQIGGVEVALQLNYERLRSQMNPSYWPELQLNLG
ncbi:uncharacterized protein LOC123310422 [Coccinella septempunctata]|uniref:uncharacterized protein LOC123310422 n=1 Tax=Coccinella septempunctata TaxID=41139 RepID=UPI001D07A78C|nr:uncharacterized protein LOC123310422 [Coccinella septempunctata]